MYGCQLILAQFEGPPPPLQPMRAPIGPDGLFIDELAPYGGHPPAIVTAGVHRPSANNYPVVKKSEHESNGKTKEGENKNSKGKSKKQSDKNKETVNKEYDSPYPINRDLYGGQELVGPYGPVNGNDHQFDHEDHREKHGKKEFKTTTTTPSPGAWSSLSNTMSGAWSEYITKFIALFNARIYFKHNLLI